MKTQFADQHPKVVTALNQLRGGKITAEQMRQMNYEVNVQKRSAAEVAKRYLQEEGLLKGSD